METLNKIILEENIKSNYTLNVLFDGICISKQKIQIIGNEIIIERSDHNLDLTRKEIMKELCYGIPLYYDYIKNGLINNWTCKIMNVWGWGDSTSQIHYLVHQFINEWPSDNFENKIKSLLIKQNGCEDEYDMCMDSVMEVLNNINRFTYK